MRHLWASWQIVWGRSGGAAASRRLWHDAGVRWCHSGPPKGCHSWVTLLKSGDVPQCRDACRDVSVCCLCGRTTLHWLVWSLLFEWFLCRSGLPETISDVSPHNGPPRVNGTYTACKTASLIYTYVRTHTHTPTHPHTNTDNVRSTAINTHISKYNNNMDVYHPPKYPPAF